MGDGKQQELGNMPPRDAVGDAAVKYLKAREKAVTAKEKAEDASKELVAAMRSKRRKDIKVEGVIITLSHMEAQDKLKVKKPKE